MTATALTRNRQQVPPANFTSAVQIGGWSKVMLAVAAVMGMLAFAWPLFLRPGATLTASTLSPIVLAALLPMVLGVVVAGPIRPAATLRTASCASKSRPEVL